MEKIDSNSTLAQIVNERPAAARILQRRGLDFCCGGRDTLEQACRQANLAASEVLDEIARAETPPASLAPGDHSPAALIDHILKRYHEPLRGDLQEILDLAQKAERAHGAKPEWPGDLVGHLQAVRAAVEEHLAKEEQVLFPMIQAGRGAMAQMPIQVMMHEHEDHGENLRRTRRLTADFTPPSSACATWRALYDGLEKLELDLMEHIHLENNVLFPRVLSGGDEVPR